jgi:plastocyanin
MHQSRTPVLAMLVWLMILPSAVRAATVNVDVGGSELSFRPQVVTINVGDTVMWTNRGGSHNVVADNRTFSSGSADSGDWAFSHTFNTAGTFNYHCQPHGALGMTGTVIVQAAGGEERGALRFGQASYSVTEGGAATITVQRVGGDDGAVSVTFSAIAGSAGASDFTAVNGTLTWANNDDDPKTFAVATANDSASEANETVQLRLTNPTAGATLGSPSTALLTIQDNDGTPGGTPAAPDNLQAMAHSRTEIMLTWTDSSNNETGFAIERRTIAEGAFQQVAAVGPNTGTAIVSGLDPATFYLFRVRALGTGTIVSAPSNEVGIATLGDTGACIAGPETLCVNGGRFQVEVAWRIPDGSTGAGKAVPIPSAPDSGLFYFFNTSNIEMLLKVLNACGLNQRYWVFFAATTNVELAVVVTDTQTGQTRSYFNPLNRPAPPVQDTDAFPTCP